MRLFADTRPALRSSIAAKLIRLWLGTHRYRFVLDDAAAVPHTAAPSIYVFWHEMLLFPTFTHGSAVTPLVSHSSDGELIDQVIRRFGGRTIRGATDRDGTDRGGRRAFRQMLRYGREHHVAIPLDGPVGPRRRVSPGAVVLASRNSMPIIPLGIAPSWSRTVGPAQGPIHLPMLFCGVWFVVGRPLDIRPALPRSRRDEAVQLVQSAMEDVQARAEAFAAGERPPARPLTLAEAKSL
ncbi:MAG: lysophospholipid acyltransferase family protein [Planctomycetota bacterium]|jgi:lysophospholipid acyltransferase (LPLAT)-like uncharacterized protein